MQMKMSYPTGNWLFYPAGDKNQLFIWFEKWFSPATTKFHGLLWLFIDFVGNEMLLSRKIIESLFNVMEGGSGLAGWVFGRQFSAWGPRPHGRHQSTSSPRNGLICIHCGGRNVSTSSSAGAEIGCIHCGGWFFWSDSIQWRLWAGRQAGGWGCVCVCENDCANIPADWLGFFTALLLWKLSDLSEPVKRWRLDSSVLGSSSHRNPFLPSSCFCWTGPICRHQRWLRHILRDGRIEFWLLISALIIEVSPLGRGIESKWAEIPKEKRKKNETCRKLVDIFVFFFLLLPSFYDGLVITRVGFDCVVGCNVAGG